MGSSFPHAGADRAIVLVVAVVCAVSGAAGRDANAGQWNVSGTAGQSVFFEDNIGLRENNKASDVGFITSPEAEITYATPRWTTVFGTGVDFARYVDHSEFDYEDVFGSLGSHYSGELYRIGFDSEVSWETTLGSEETDTGNFEDSGRRFGVNLQPYWTYSVTPRDSIGLRGLFSLVRYNDTRNLEDFSFYSLTADYGRQVTQRDNVGIAVTGSHYENDDVDGEKTDTVASRLFWAREFSPRLKTRVSAGVNYSMSDQIVGTGIFRRTVEDNKLGAELGASVDWQFDERTDLGAKLERTIAASGGGNAIERSFASLTVTHRFKERLRGRLKTYFQHNDSVSGSDRNDRTFFSFAPNLRWEFAKDWHLTGEYRFRWQDDGGGGDAISNRVLATVSYQFPAWRFSD